MLVLGSMVKNKALLYIYFEIKEAMSQVFLCLGVKVLFKSKLRAFSYLEYGFLRAPRRNKVNS